MSEQKHTKGRGNRGRQSRERGQSLVETAIVFPVLLLLLAAVVDFGRAFDAYIVLTNAAREGARWGAVNPQLTADEVKQIVIDDVLGSGTNITNWTGFGDQEDDITVVGQGAGNEEVTVVVTYEFRLWFSGLIGFDTVTLSKTSVMPRWRNE
jgi:Flp pilus assembly protein TadG